MSVIKLMWLCD